ncbi:signal transduction protein [Thermotomaculum hydrothermale]|uniref:Signal transduction protein n=1 Tax=Thermotomaculum hydrothermale TaxID=981385 RepID=A0A7R6PDN9_9BACT|nr:GGDEF domain-containing protein [Thermotomaculum hydrothermale]BBB31834.1 signal transduction protein [Thermotomaculum hydrothermale]
MYGRDRRIPVNVSEDKCDLPKLCYLFVISGKEENDFFKIPKETFLIGSSLGCDFRLSDKKIPSFCIEAKPVFKNDSLVKLKIKLLKGNVFIGNKKVTKADLKIGDVLRIGNTVFKLEKIYPFEIEYRNLIEEKIKKGYVLDREDSFYFLEKFFNIAEKYKRPLSLIVFQVDYFSLIKDSFSEKEIEQIFREARRIYKKTIRKSDILGRIEENKFVIILPETHEIGAITLARRIKERFKTAVFRVEGEEHTFSVSQGVVSLDCHHYSNFEEFLLAGEKFLEKAVKKGKASIEYCREVNA